MRYGFSQDGDNIIFKVWVKEIGKYIEGVDEVDLVKWKVNLCCVFNKSWDFCFFYDGFWDMLFQFYKIYEVCFNGFVFIDFQFFEDYFLGVGEEEEEEEEELQRMLLSLSFIDVVQFGFYMVFYFLFKDDVKWLFILQLFVVLGFFVLDFRFLVFFFGNFVGFREFFFEVLEFGFLVVSLFFVSEQFLFDLLISFYMLFLIDLEIKFQYWGWLFWVFIISNFYGCWFFYSQLEVIQE